MMLCMFQVRAADPVFSGPQPGEVLTGFKVLDLSGQNAGKERDPVAENKGAPTTFVFIHAIERSLVPLLRVIDEYGSRRKEMLKTEIVFLFADRVAGEQRIKAVVGSLKLKSRVGFSLDGAEGPGNYGLNKDCMMTVVAARKNKTEVNFALVQPGIADAPQVLAALARLCGDENPPAVDSLIPKAAGRGEMAGKEGEPKTEVFSGIARESPLTVHMLNATGLASEARLRIPVLQEQRGDMDRDEHRESAPLGAGHLRLLEERRCGLEAE